MLISAAKVEISWPRVSGFRIRLSRRRDSLRNPRERFCTSSIVHWLNNVEVKTVEPRARIFMMFRAAQGARKTNVQAFMAATQEPHYDEEELRTENGVADGNEERTEDRRYHGTRISFRFLLSASAFDGVNQSIKGAPDITTA